MKKITVKIKNVYGIESIYPLCADAKLFAKIAGTKTLTAHAVRDIQSLGYEIEIEYDQPKILRALVA
jgi:hypothetical protein